MSFARKEMGRSLCPRQIRSQEDATPPAVRGRVPKAGGGNTDGGKRKISRCSSAGDYSFDREYAGTIAISSTVSKLELATRFTRPYQHHGLSTGRRQVSATQVGLSGTLSLGRGAANGRGKPGEQFVRGTMGVEWAVSFAEQHLSQGNGASRDALGRCQDIGQLADFGFSRADLSTLEDPR
jgi:hypothetical protein